VKIAATSLALAALIWATWPDAGAYPALAPEDAEAIRGVRDLQRGRAGAWEAIVRARNPRTVPALMVLADRDALFDILHPPQTRTIRGVEMLLPRESFCCGEFEKPHSPADAFESALQAAVMKGSGACLLKKRGCVSCLRTEDVELERRLEDPEPGVRFAAAFQLWTSGRAESVPRALGCLGEHAFARYAWLEPVAEIVRRETSCAALCEGGPRALAAAGFLKHRAAIPAIVRRLNDPREREGKPDLVWSLGEIGDPAAIPILEGLLKDSNVHVRGDAAEALAKLRAISSLPLLRRLAAEEDARYPRIHAAWALAELGSADDFDLVESFSRHAADALRRRLRRP
jgi:hypothetical protein